MCRPSALMPHFISTSRSSVASIMSTSSVDGTGELPKLATPSVEPAAAAIGCGRRAASSAAFLSCAPSRPAVESPALVRTLRSSLSSIKSISSADGIGWAAVAGRIVATVATGRGRRAASSAFALRSAVETRPSVDSPDFWITSRSSFASINSISSSDHRCAVAVGFAVGTAACFDAAGSDAIAASGTPPGSSWSLCRSCAFIASTSASDGILDFASDGFGAPCEAIASIARCRSSSVPSLTPKPIPLLSSTCLSSPWSMNSSSSAVHRAEAEAPAMPERLDIALAERERTTRRRWSGLRETVKTVTVAPLSSASSTGST